MEFFLVEITPIEGLYSVPDDLYGRTWGGIPVVCNLGNYLQFG